MISTVDLSILNDLVSLFNKFFSCYKKNIDSVEIDLGKFRINLKAKHVVEAYQFHKVMDMLVGYDERYDFFIAFWVMKNKRPQLIQTFEKNQINYYAYFDGDYQDYWYLVQLELDVSKNWLCKGTVCEVNKFIKDLKSFLEKE